MQLNKLSPIAGLILATMLGACGGGGGDDPAPASAPPAIKVSAIVPGQDELAFLPLIYWPMTAEQSLPSDAAASAACTDAGTGSTGVPTDRSTMPSSWARAVAAYGAMDPLVDPSEPGSQAVNKRVDLIVRTSVGWPCRPDAMMRSACGLACVPWTAVSKPERPLIVK